MKVYRVILVLALILPAVGLGQGETGTYDRKRLAAIQSKRLLGEPLTPEEMEFVKGVGDLRKKRSEEFSKSNAPRESTGLVPLTDLATGSYQGERGGLYPEGENVPPRSHRKAGLKIAKHILPLDAEGRKSKEGKIVLLSIGMSNTTQEFQVFQKRAAADPVVNPSLAVVDGAQGGQAAEVIAYPQMAFWKVVDQRLKGAGVTPKQVQVVWLKQAIIMPSEPFPTEARALQRYLVDILHILNDRFPNLKITYLSSRIYGGYAVTPLNPEPHAYESAFSVKWVIADQIAGKPELNYDPARGQVRSPWLAWGPYLWADGGKGRKDGLVYLREDLDRDGTHPAMPGREKVAKLLLDFLKKDPTARPWFAKR